jgi:L-lactate dehydrogenase complex protein LldG
MRIPLPKMMRHWREAETPSGVIPARGQQSPDRQVQLFVKMLEAVNGTVEHVGKTKDLPKRIAAFLRKHNLPQELIHGADTALAGLPWDTEATLTVKRGPADGSEVTGLSHARAGVAETGTLILESGGDNPTTINFLPEVHMVVVRAGDIVGDYETAWAALRQRHGKGEMPRTVNMVTGPSRSADIEQTLLLGAHGPRKLHVMIVD